MQFGQTRHSSALHSGKILVLLLIYALLWFGTLNYRHLIPSDEGRYAEMAREMLVTGDWITPRYNGYKYFENPHFKFGQRLLPFKCLVWVNGRQGCGQP